MFQEQGLSLGVLEFKSPFLSGINFQLRIRKLNSMEFPEDIYSTRILEVVASMPEITRLGTPDGSAVKHSKLCGSKVSVDVNLDNEGRISDFGLEVEACLLGQTSAAVMARHAVGLSRSEVEDVRARMEAMLKEGGAPPTGIWSDLEVLYPVRDYKPRHASMLLVFDAVLAAMDQAAESRGIDLVGHEAAR